MKKSVLFDLDGTLLDTVPDIRAALNASLAAFGYAPVSYEQTVAYVGNGAKKLVERTVPAGGDAGGVLAAFAERYTQSENALTRPYDGMRELLSSLKAAGFGLAVVTNKLQDSADKVIAKFYPALFDVVMGDSGLFPCKPDPAIARYAALSLRTPLGDCFFVGDGETDVFTARNAGMVGVSTLWGYRTRAQLEAAGAKIFAENVAALQEILLPAADGGAGDGRE